MEKEMKFYEAPEMEVLDMVVEGAILGASTGMTDEPETI